jgi:protein TonB
MSYIDQENGSRRVAIGGVVLLHIVVGYALISGFAITAIKYISPPLVVGQYPDEIVPPPQPPPSRPPTAHEDPVLTETVVRLDGGTGPLITKTDPVIYPPFEPTITPPPPPQISKARDAIAGPGRSTWVSNEDYPPGALRVEAQGVVGINVAVGTDGRVTGCEVTASSGNDQLDQATCRLYARRARFQPALDADGNPTPSRHSDRIRWQIPE